MGGRHRHRLVTARDRVKQVLDGIALTMLVTGIVIMNKMAKFEI